MDTLLRGVCLAHDIFEHSPLREIVGEAVWPARDVSLAKGSSSLDDAISRHARTLSNPLVLVVWGQMINQWVILNYVFGA